jgi:hypothetical protein
MREPGKERDSLPYLVRDDVQIYSEEKGRGAALLLSHGFGATLRMFDPQGMKWIASVVLSLVLALSSGCMLSQKVKYSVKDVPRVSVPAFSDKTLVVKEFEDLRRPKRLRGKSRAFNKPVPTLQSEGREWYYNSLENYKDKTVTPWITDMIVKHIKAAETFKSVSEAGEDAPEGDIVLAGKIKEFRGAIERSSEAESIQRGSMLFGAAGALLGLGVIHTIKVDYTGTTELVDVTLTEVETEKLLWEGHVEGKVAGEMSASTTGWEAYEKASLSLKEAINKLLEEFEKIDLEKQPADEQRPSTGEGS